MKEFHLLVHYPGFSCQLCNVLLYTPHHHLQAFKLYLQRCQRNFPYRCQFDALKIFAVRYFKLNADRCTVQTWSDFHLNGLWKFQFAQIMCSIQYCYGTHSHDNLISLKAVKGSQLLTPALVVYISKENT